MAGSLVLHQQGENNPQRGAHEICQRYRQQQLPSQRHQLVIAKARQGSARPYIKEKQPAHFQQKPEWPLNHWHNRGKQTKCAEHQRAAGNYDELNPRNPSRSHHRVISQIHSQSKQQNRRQILQKRPAVRKRRKPSTQKQNRRQKRNGEHVRVFRHEKHRELKTGILSVKSRNKFRLRLRQIKRHAVRLRNSRSEVTKKTDNLRKYVPARNKRKVTIVSSLVRNHLVEIQRPRKQHHANHRQRQRHFVADHLRRTPQPTQQWILAVRRPPSQRHAIHADRRDRKKKHQANIYVRDNQLRRLPEDRNRRRPEGNQRNRRQRQKRREDVQKFIRSRRRHILFEQKFHAVSQRLQQSVRAHIVRAPARLNVRHDFAFKPSKVRQRRQCQKKQNDDLY